MNNQQSKQKLLTKMWLFYCSCLLIVGLALALVLFKVIIDKKFTRQLNKLQLDLNEFNRCSSVIKDNTNAAKYYNKAFNLYHKSSDKIFKLKYSAKMAKGYFEKKGQLNNKITTVTVSEFYSRVLANKLYPPLYNFYLLLGQPLTSEDLQANRLFLKENFQCIKTLKQATQYPHCHFNINFKQNYTVREHLYKFDCFATLIATETIMAVHTNNSTLVTNNILTILRISHALDSEPTLLSYIKKLEIINLSVKIIEYSLSILELNTSQRQQISNALMGCLDKQDKIINRILISNCMMNLDLVSNGISPSIMRKSQSPAMLKFYQLTSIDNLNKLKIIEIYNKLIKLDKNDIKVLKHFDETLNIQREELSFIYNLAKLALPRYNIYGKLTSNTRIQLTILGLSVIDYRQKYHKLPKKLSDLVPEFIDKIAHDPFTGKPFKYVVGNIELMIQENNGQKFPNSYKKFAASLNKFIKRPGWMIYSLGQDQDDNQGIPYAAFTSWYNGDISFKWVIHQKTILNK